MFVLGLMLFLCFRGTEATGQITGFRLEPITGGIEVFWNANQTVWSSGTSLRLILIEGNWRLVRQPDPQTGSIRLLKLTPCKLHCVSLEMYPSNSTPFEIGFDCTRPLPETVPQPGYVRVYNLRSVQHAVLYWSRPMEIPNFCKLRYHVKIQEVSLKEALYSFSSNGPHLLKNLKSESNYSLIARALWNNMTGDWTTPLHFVTQKHHTMQPFYNVKAQIVKETAHVTWNALQVDLMGSAHVHSTKKDWHFLHIPSVTQAVFQDAQACTLYQFRVAFLPSEIQDVPAFTCAFAPPANRSRCHNVTVHQDNSVYSYLD